VPVTNAEISKEKKIIDSKSKIKKDKKSLEISKDRIIKFEDLESILINKNEQLKKYKIQIEESKLLLKGKTAAWAPKATLSSSSIPSYDTGYSNNKLSSDSETNQLKYGLDTNFEWDLIQPKRRLEIEIAKSKIENAKLQYKVILKDLYLDSVKKFLAIQASIQEIKVSEKAIEISNTSLNDAKNRFLKGVGNKLDVLEAKTQLRRDQINLINKENILKSNKNQLAEILNINGGYKILDNQTNLIEFFWDYNFQESFASFIKNSEVINISKRNIKINEDESFVILSDKKPSFTIYNKYSFSSIEGESGVPPLNLNNEISNYSNTVGLRFNWNIFDGGRIKQNFLAKINRNKELESDLNLKKSQIKRDLKDTFNEYRNIKDKMMLSYEQVEAAKESLFISTKRVESGITTQREIINAQGDLIEAETNFINSIKEYKIILAKFYRITSIKPINFCSMNPQNNKNDSVFYEFLKNKNLISKCNKV
tara:strand:+ start:1069 stop:2514 length:1446 start_codon:yes stop_codon:yes gene_type:complete